MFHAKESSAHTLAKRPSINSEIGQETCCNHTSFESKRDIDK